MRVGALVANIRASVSSFCLAAAAAGMVPGTAAAQSLTPMRGEIRSMTEQFAVRVHPGNPYNRRIRVDVRVYDEKFREIPGAVALPAFALIAPQDQRSVMVMVPFDGHSERKVRVCAESVPHAAVGTITQQVKAQVCGKFLARRL